MALAFGLPDGRVARPGYGGSTLDRIASSYE